MLHFGCAFACLVAIPGSTEFGATFRHQSLRSNLFSSNWYYRFTEPFFRLGGKFSDPESFSNLDEPSFEADYGHYSLFYQPYREDPSADQMYTYGDSMTWGHRVGVDWRLRNGMLFSIRERLYYYGQSISTSYWRGTLYANPIFENRFTARLEIPVGKSGIMARFPVHMKQVTYRSAEGATYSGQLRNWIWLSPELGIPVGRAGELALTYETETFVSSRNGQWDFFGGLIEGAIELTYRLQL